MSEAICRSCGNSGTDLTGGPCWCKVPPRYAEEHHRVAREHDHLAARVKQLEARNAELTTVLRRAAEDLRDVGAVKVLTAMRLGEVLAEKLPPAG